MKKFFFYTLFFLSLPQILFSSVGIITAFDKHQDLLIDAFDSVTHKSFYSFDFYSGNINNVSYTVVKPNMGSLNNAIAALILIDKWNPDIILSFAFAGTLDTGLKQGDICIGNSFEWYEYGTEKDFGFVYGINTGLSKPVLCNFGSKNFPFVSVKIISGDKFIESKVKKDYLKTSFKASLVDSNSYHIAKVCNIAKKKNFIFRVVSDYSADNARKQFKDFAADYDYKKFNNIIFDFFK